MALARGGKRAKIVFKNDTLAYVLVGVRERKLTGETVHDCFFWHLDKGSYRCSAIADTDENWH